MFAGCIFVVHHIPLFLLIRANVVRMKQALLKIQALPKSTYMFITQSPLGSQNMNVQQFTGLTRSMPYHS